MLEKILLVGLLKFVFPGDLMQAACGLLVTIIFMLAFTANMPYNDQRTNRLTIVTSSIMAFSYFCTIFLKIDLSVSYISVDEIAMLMVWINMPMTVCATGHRLHFVALPTALLCLCFGAVQECAVVQQTEHRCANNMCMTCCNRYFMADVMTEISEILSDIQAEMELVQKSVAELKVSVKIMTTVLKGHLEDNQGHFENPVHGSIDDEAAAFSNPLGSMEVEARAEAIFSNPLESMEVGAHADSERE